MSLGEAPGSPVEVLLVADPGLPLELADLRPRDMIDLQSFLWVQGSDEYP